MENRRRILNLLAEGKISVEEADRLMSVASQQAAEGVSQAVAEEPLQEEPERVSVVVESDEGDEDSTVRDDAFAVGESPKIIVNNANGRVVVMSGDDGEVRVHAELKDASKIDYRVIQDGDTVQVDAKPQDRASLFGIFGRHRGADITVTTPRKSSVEVKNANGRVELHDIDGNGTLNTANGRILMERLKGEFEANTRNSRIEARGLEGSAKLRTANGRVEIEDAKGVFDAATSNGSVIFSGELTPGGQNRMQTSNGSVKVKFTGEPSVKIDASTSNGRIKRTMPMNEVTNEKHRLVGTIGGGEAELVARTSNGSITFE